VRHEFRPSFGRALTVFVAAVAGVAFVAMLVAEPATALRAAPLLALGAGACWALFWRPAVEVSDGGVRLVNPLRTIDLSWPSIQAVDTKFALTLITAYGRYTAWAAPAPGARGVMRATRQDTANLPASARHAGTIRPGDLPSSPSGEAALLIRRHWESLRDAGHLDDPKLERDAAPVTWHVATMVVGGALLVLSVVAVVA
jgi:hypothetical protein